MLESLSLSNFGEQLLMVVHLKCIQRSGYLAEFSTFSMAILIEVRHPHEINLVLQLILIRTTKKK